MKFYKLGVNQSVFWDPTQTEEGNQKLVSNWTLPLEETDAVRTARTHEVIVVASEDEVAAYYKSIKKKVPTEPTKEEAGKGDEGSKDKAE
jgi:hypothetical protein